MANSERIPPGEGRSWPEQRVVRVDKSPMNPKIKIAQLTCGHDVYRNRAPRVGATIACEECSRRLASSVHDPQAPQ